MSRKAQPTLAVAAQRFEADFAKWAIKFPAQSLQAHIPGQIERAGWFIQYTFGRDASGEYLDYYAEHRMSSDVHRRIYADGTTEDLPAYPTLKIIGRTPTEAAQFEKAHQRAKAEVGRLLKAKGFDRGGP